MKLYDLTNEDLLAKSELRERISITEYENLKMK